MTYCESSRCLGIQGVDHKLGRLVILFILSMLLVTVVSKCRQVSLKIRDFKAPLL